ncbi:hypothetical protein ACQPYK_04115 [Streptosporangium sp. CA-135522]|uniref:hypothetical protein n=1 Tax=Streptosporangium sp. CA-135522 TaxID=3240072 RepID=UPI003D94FB2F
MTVPAIQAAAGPRGPALATALDAEASIQQSMAQAVRLGYRVERPHSPRRPGTVTLLTLTGSQIAQREDVAPRDVTATIAELVQPLDPSGDLDRGRWGRGLHDRRPGVCRFCNSGGPDGDHQRTVCRACDMPQCLYPHECRICYVGYLDGVSYGLYGDERLCGYRRCANPAVAKAPRVQRVCRDHLARVTRTWGGRTINLADDITERIALLGQTYGVPDWQRAYWFDGGA